MDGLRVLVASAFAIVAVGCDSIPFFQNRDAETPPPPPAASLPPAGPAGAVALPSTPIEPIAVQPVPAPGESEVDSEGHAVKSDAAASEPKEPAQKASNEKKTSKTKKAEKNEAGAAASVAVDAEKGDASVKAGVSTKGGIGLKPLGGVRKMGAIKFKKTE